jgi:hypothetical protein
MTVPVIWQACYASLHPAYLGMDIVAFLIKQSRTKYIYQYESDTEKLNVILDYAGTPCSYAKN